ncbi:conjugal transfer protein TraN [Thioalkalivibrio sp. ALMg11]|uniref:conjugal transfer protein TraN n=1 Tax=Thioalkalivibrio sp. ALMg11 TaxID=1158165 RepID=UPI0018CB5DE6|nr:conjugal transfer protein TraN [Thioalkalivibrio sp. ALMg11]
MLLTAASALMAPWGSGAQAFDASKYETCWRLSTECVDSGTKTIDGMTLTRECWEYEQTYACYTEHVDYCSPLEREDGCFETSSVCAETDHRGQCIRYTKTFQCSDELEPQPQQTEKLEDAYVISSEELDYSMCDGENEDPYCADVERVCLEGPETRNIDGKDVYRECWKWDYRYHCLGEWDDTCDAIDSGCTFSHEECFSTVEIDGVEECTATSRYYDCPEEGTTRTFESCGTNSVCADGNCFDTSHPSAADDFLQAATAMEAARQAGEYFNEDDFQIFKGEAERCRVWVRFGSVLGIFGDPDCCSAGGGTARSNQSVMQEAGMGAGRAAVDAGYSMASDYMYDFMFDQGSGWMADKAVDAWYSGSWGPDSIGTDFGIGFYGFEVSWSAAGGLQFGFDPWSFAIAVAIHVITEMMACDEDEIITGGKVEAGLCHKIGRHCTRDVTLIGCVRRHDEFCCYNSKLARIINVQGRPQIGKSWGSPGSQDCSGFSPEEFQQLDFSQIDMSEFYNDILNSAHVPDEGLLNEMIEKNADLIQQRTEDFYQ